MAMFETPRRYGAVNWRGMGALCAKEVRRFLEIYGQTIMGPVVTGLLFLSVFALALGGPERMVGGLPFLQFLAPGIIAMTMVQQAFANSSSSLIVAKVQGNIVDVLMPPLGAPELTIGYAFGGVVRGLLCGLAVALAMVLFVALRIHHPLAVLYFAVMGSLMLSLLGTLTGIVALKFDHVAFITNFIVTPLAFLSGTFYSIERLPEPFHAVALFNPFFYMIDGFRYGLTGHADGSLAVGAAVMLAADLALAAAVYLLFWRGFRLKS